MLEMITIILPLSLVWAILYVGYNRSMKHLNEQD